MAGFGDALRVREFRAPWLAEGLSVGGDQVARVALALVVFDRTNSAALTALTFVLAVFGGVLVTATGPALALLVNAATFLTSAAVVVAFVRPRPAARVTRSTGGAAKAGPAMVAVYAFAALVGFLVVPEGLAAPYAASAGIGSAVWALSGGLSTVYLIRLQAAVVGLVPDARRGTVMGRLSTCLYSSQGVAIVGGGVLAEQLGPATAIAVSGGLATVTALPAAAVWRASARRAALAPA